MTQTNPPNNQNGARAFHCSPWEPCNPQLSVPQVAPSPSTLYKDPLADCTINLSGKSTSEKFVDFQNFQRCCFLRNTSFLVPKQKIHSVFSSSSRFEATNRQNHQFKKKTRSFFVVPKHSGGSKSTMKQIVFGRLTIICVGIYSQQFQGAIFLMVGLTARVNKRYTHHLIIKLF